MCGEASYVDGIEAGAAQPPSRRLGLAAPDRRQRWVACRPAAGALTGGDDLAVLNEEHVGGGVGLLGGRQDILLGSPTGAVGSPDTGVARASGPAAATPGPAHATRPVGGHWRASCSARPTNSTCVSRARTPSGWPRSIGMA